MSSGHQRIKWRRNIAENFNRLSRVHERFRQTDDRQQTDGQTTTCSEHEHEYTFAKNVNTWKIIRAYNTYFNRGNCGRKWRPYVSLFQFLANVNSCSRSLYVVVRPSVVCRLSSVTFVHPTQSIEIFGNVSATCNTFVNWRHSGKILRRSSQGNPSVGGLNQRVSVKM